MYIAIANAIYSSGAEGGGGGKVPLTDATFQQAVNDALAEEPVTGLFDVVPYGMMPDWDVSQVTIMSDAFESAEFFNGDISAWDVSSVTDMDYMFDGAYDFNGDIGGWDVSSVTSMGYMFARTETFNQDISTWNTISATNMAGMFLNTDAFNQDISAWDVSSVTDMNSMFEDTQAFNQNINSWDVSSVELTEYMFSNATVFNQPLDSWDVSSVTDMNNMFAEAPLFNQSLNSWDVSSVTDMNNMFSSAEAFDGDISAWDVSSVEDMNSMFSGNTFGTNTIFNRDISAWDVSNVTNMRRMFYKNIAFNQNLSLWGITQVANFIDFMTDVTLSTPNYDALLIGWDAQGAMSYSGTVDFGNSQYTSGGAAEAARTSLIAKWGGINDGGPVSVPFTISVKTDNVGTSNSDQFTIPWTGTYDVDWGDGNTDTSVVDAQTHTYATAGTYDVSVTAVSGRIAFANVGDKLKLLDIKSWGDTAWTSMSLAFRGCSNLTVSATDTPDLSNLTNINWMFQGCLSFNSPINNWDVSNVTNMDNVFNDAFVFNQDLDLWDVSNVTNMSFMFMNAKVFNGNITTWNVGNVLSFNNFLNNWKVQSGTFNQDLSSWDVSSVTNMANMFSYQSSFNQDITSWNVSSVTNMSIMFAFSGFNQPIGIWNVSNVTNMNQMFEKSSFDQSLSAWNTSNVTNMGRMFNNVSKVRDNIEISGWTVSQVTNFLLFATGTTLSTANYDALLIGWDAQGAMSYSGTVQFGSSKYTLGGAAEAARTSLIAKWGAITDGGGVLDATTNLVASYSFDTDFSDYTGNNPLTANGNATAGVTGGKVSDCAELDGSDDYTVAADSSDFSFTNNANDLPFSFSFWANFDTVPGLNALVVPFSKTTYEGIEYIFSYANGDLYMNLYSQSLQNVSISAKFSFLPVVGDWNHIVITYDGSSVFSGIKPYINSVSIPTTSNNEGSYLYMVDTPSSLNIGSQGWIPTEGEFDGKLDEFHIWKNRELTQSEVTDIYNTENAGNSILP